MSSEPQLTLYTAQTPNGVKISIALELLGLPYKVHQISLGKHEQKEPWFLAINPNGRIPALTDHKPPIESANGEPLHFMETGAILQYLADNYDPDHKISFPKNSREHWEMIQWLTWQMSGQGPMQGQANHFIRYAPEKIQYGIDRYTNETRRLYGILDKRLGEQEKALAAKGKDGLWVAGDHISIADISCFDWASLTQWVNIDIADFPYVKKWIEQIEKIPAVDKGRDVPEPSAIRKAKGDKSKLEEIAAKSRAWIMQGMQNDAKI